MHATLGSWPWNFRLFGSVCLIGFLLMTTGTRTIGGEKTGGAVGPGLQPPSPSALARELQKKAASKSPDDLREVRRALTSGPDLLQLNTAQEYADLPPEKLALQAILTRLSGNPSPAAVEAVVSLCDNQPFLAEQSRLECLLLTLPKVRPFPEKAVPLLRKSAEPGSDSLELAIRALFEIGEKSTLDIFASQVLSGQQDTVLIQAWLRDPLLRHRREPAVLQMSLDLLQQPKLDVELKNSLVEALYDYRPADWYSGETPPPKPPASKKLSAEADGLLKKIAAVIAADPAISAANKSLAVK